jgi:hypothetical protein
VDWRYVRRGGIRATRSDKFGVLAAGGLGLAIVAFLEARGASPQSLGVTKVTIGTIVFGLWELARWRVRRKNPLTVAGFQDSNPRKGIVYTESELEAIKAHTQDRRSD